MKARLASLVPLVALWTACAALQPVRPYEEGLIGGFDPGEWTVANQASDENQSIVEFVKPGERIESWTELLTLQVFRKPDTPAPIAALVASIHAEDAKCPGFAQNVIAQGLPTETQEASMIYEWRQESCPPHADQHEVVKIVYGKFSIFRLAYVEKTRQLSTEKRAKWIQALEGARIVVNGGAN